MIFKDKILRNPNKIKLKNPDGEIIEYEIVPPSEDEIIQDSDTPISAENLNKIQEEQKRYTDNVKVELTKDMIVAQLKTTTYIGKEMVKLPMTKEQYKKGEKLSLSDNGIKIGAGVSKIKVSANLTPLVGGKNGYTWLNILKNNIAVFDVFGTGREYVSTVSVSDLILNVKENDLIEIQMAYETYHNENRIDVTKYNNTNFLTVEVLENEIVEPTEVVE